LKSAIEMVTISLVGLGNNSVLIALFSTILFCGGLLNLIPSDSALTRPHP